VSSQLHASAEATPGKRVHGTRWVGDWVGPRAGLDAVEINLFLVPRINPRTSSLYLVTMSTELSKLRQLSIIVNKYCHYVGV
jgi:hypothetical protein